MTSDDQTQASPRHSRRIAYDYDSVADHYDRHRRIGGPFVEPLVRLALECNARRVVEIGPGTGNNTMAFIHRHPCSLVGVDQSMNMLRIAAAKAIDVRWIQGDVHRLPLASHSADFVFAVLVLQHVPDLAAACAECVRVLDHGHVAFVTASHEFIQRHPMNAYFPSFATVDKARFPTIGSIHERLMAAGCRSVGVEHAVAPPEVMDGSYVERVAGKFISTYDLIPDSEFRAGVERLRAEIVDCGRLPVPMEWEAAIVWGSK